MKTFGFIGCGTMGSAIAECIAPLQNAKILLYDVREEAAKKLASSTNATVVSLTELLEQSHIVVLAVKPQVLPLLYNQLGKYQDIRWISLAAGVSLATLSKQLHSNNIIRIMPNIAAAIGRSVTAVCPHEQADPHFIEEAMAFVNNFGTGHTLEEKDLAAFIGVSASAIATGFAFLHGIAMGGVHQGLPYAKALALISDTIESATALTRQTHQHPQELQTQVCSPGGTTIEAMKVLGESGFMGILMESVAVASQKTRDLEAVEK